jgi:serine/threonine protein kinase
MPARTDLPHEFGRYRILRKLGEGGMGAVYLAEDTELGRRVALTVLYFDPDADPVVIERYNDGWSSCRPLPSWWRLNLFLPARWRLLPASM